MFCFSCITPTASHPTPEPFMIDKSLPFQAITGEHTFFIRACCVIVLFMYMQNFQDQVLQWLQRRFSISAAQAAQLPPVYVYGRHVDDATYPRLYASCDCVVLPTR